MVGITLEKLQRGADRTLVLSPILCMQSSRAIFTVYLCLQIYVGFVAPFISYNREKLIRDIIIRKLTSQNIIVKTMQ